MAARRPPAGANIAADAVRVGDSPVSLVAGVVDTRGAAMEVPGAWTTSDASVVSVDGAGRVTAVRSGTATVRASVGELRDFVLVEADLLASATLEIPALLTEGERAPLAWAARDDAGGAWEGTFTCTSTDDTVLAMAGTEIVAVSHGSATVTCTAAGRSVHAQTRVVPAAWDAFAWRHGISVEVGDRAVALFSREDVPVDDWVRLGEVFAWRTDTGRPAYVVLVEEHDLTVAWSCYRGQVVVISADGLHVQARLDLPGARCTGMPRCAGCPTQRIDHLAPPRFTAEGLVVGDVRYGWKDGGLVRGS